MSRDSFHKKSVQKRTGVTYELASYLFAAKTLKTGHFQETSSPFVSTPNNETGENIKNGVAALLGRGREIRFWTR